MSRHSPNVPRNGHTLVVGIVARISGCENQNELSLKGQIDHAKEIVAEMNSGPVEFRSGEHVAHSSRTSRRLKQKLLNRFIKFGARDLLALDHERRSRSAP